MLRDVRRRGVRARRATRRPRARQLALPGRQEVRRHSAGLAAEARSGWSGLTAQQFVMMQSSALKSAAHVLGCVHIRLRGLHAKLMGQEANQHEKSQFEVNLSSVLADVQKPSMLMDSIAELPAFGKAHSPQYTKLVLGVANTCVTVLSQTQQYKVRSSTAHACIYQTCPLINHRCRMCMLWRTEICKHGLRTSTRHLPQTSNSQQR